MAIADYYARNALAAAQAIEGFDHRLFRERVESTTIGLRFDAQAASSLEGRCLLDMSVRLLARLYPTLSFRGTDPAVADLASLARAINPSIDIGEADPDFEIVIGHGSSDTSRQLFVGCNAWDAILSADAPLEVGSSSMPFGAAAAACLASAQIFTAVFRTREGEEPFWNQRFSVVDAETRAAMPNDWTGTLGEAVLVGLGGVGNAASWCFSHLSATGTIHLVDNEVVDVGNLQRYVLCERADEGADKVAVGTRYYQNDILAAPHAVTWDEFVATHGYRWQRVMSAVDSARDRRAIQASLPRWVANAWTQQGDLGLSVHPRFASGACVACLYLPKGLQPSEDTLVAGALGIPDRLQEVRLLLGRGAGVSTELLEVIADRLGVDPTVLVPYAGVPLRRLYREGVCGGAVVALERLGAPREELHVPLAPQSALAGVLLASALVADCLPGRREPTTTTITRADVCRPMGDFLTVPALADGRGICVCQDTDFLTRYSEKYSLEADS